MACQEKQVYKVVNAPAAIGPYSVATGGGPFIFTSGQLAIDPKTGFFTENQPARTTIQAAALPKKALIEIDTIAMLCKEEDCC